MRGRAVIALYPGPLDAAFCTLIMFDRMGAVAGTSQLPVPTIGQHTDRDTAAGLTRAAQKAADAMLSQGGFERSGYWRQQPGDFSTAAAIRKAKGT